MSADEKGVSGKSFTMPTQELNVAALQNASIGFQEKFHQLPTKLVLQFEINLNLIGRDIFYLIGYLWAANKADETMVVKTELPIVKGKNVALKLPDDIVAFGNLELPLATAFILAGKSGNLTFTPKLYPNPHIAYDVNGYDLNPSPPAPPY